MKKVSLTLNVLCIDVLLFVWNSMKKSILYTKNNIMWWISEIFTIREYEIFLCMDTVTHQSLHEVVLMVTIILWLYSTGLLLAGEYICLITQSPNTVQAHRVDIRYSILTKVYIGEWWLLDNFTFSPINYLIPFIHTDHAFFNHTPLGTPI